MPGWGKESLHQAMIKREAAGFPLLSPLEQEIFLLPKAALCIEFNALNLHPG